MNFDTLDKLLSEQKGKIIHQIWFGTIPNKLIAKKTYEKFKLYRDSWKLKNPEWYHIEWSKQLCYDLVSKYYPEHLSMYKNYQYEIQRCDIVRYFILHRYGGLYADMDYYCNKGWDEVIKKYPYDLYLVQTPNSYKHNVSNSLMYSKPKHMFWKHVFLELELKKDNNYYTRHLTIIFTTGPGILNNVFDRKKYRYNLQSYPYKLFHPYGIGDIKLELKNNNSYYAIHLGKGSWEKKDSKLLLFFYKEWRIVIVILFILVIPIIYFKMECEEGDMKK